MSANSDVAEIVATKKQQKVKKPSMYNVILHNDDKTSFEFVIGILTYVFHKDIEEAAEITTNVHINGQGVAGTYTQEIAEQKVQETVSLAKANGFPLVATCEPN